MLSAASVSLMVSLVESHVPEDPLLAAAWYPAGKVMLCMAAASLSAVLAWLIAIPALLTRRFLPLLWLVPLFAGCVWFVGWYDWRGLFETGKAWREVARP